MTLRIGLIGAGANTRLQHIPGFQGIDGVEITCGLQPLARIGPADRRRVRHPTGF